MDDCLVRIAADLGHLEMLEARFGPQNCGRHSHETYGIGVVSAGVNRFRYRGESFATPAGRLCTVTAGEPHDCEVREGEDLTYRCLYPAPEALADAAAQLADRPADSTLFLAPVIADDHTARLVAALFEAQTECAPPLARQSLLAALLARTVTRHVTRPVRPAPAVAAPASVARARDYLHSRWAEAVSLEELAAVAGLGTFHLLRLFARSYGLPPHAYQRQLRLTRAKRLIAAGHGLSQAALEAGFADQSHFTRAFKRAYGITPGIWRAAVAAGE